MKPCAECGKNTRNRELCTKCKAAGDELNGGEWVKGAHGIMRWVEAPAPAPIPLPPPRLKSVPRKRARYVPTGNPRGRPKQAEKYAWTDRLTRLARAQYRAGIRTDWTREGNRVYSRTNQRKHRTNIEGKDAA